MTDQEDLQRKRRSRAIALSIVAFIILVYGVTLLRIGANVGGGS